MVSRWQPAGGIGSAGRQVPGPPSVKWSGSHSYWKEATPSGSGVGGEQLRRSSLGGASTLLGGVAAAAAGFPPVRLSLAGGSLASTPQANVNSF